MKSQLNMFETIAVLIVFMFLLGIGLVIYSFIHQGNVEKDVNSNRNLRAQRIAETAFFLPELDCTFRGIRPPGACLERFKIDAMAEINKDPLVAVNYFEQFGNAKITIKQVFPDNRYEKVLYDAGLDGIVKVRRTPVLILDVLKGPTSYAFGVMEVSVTYEA